MKRALVIISILAVSLIAGCSGAKTDTKTGLEPVETISTSVNQEFVISRKFDINSVYMWRESYDESILEFIEGTIESDRDEAGKVVLSKAFRFKALKRGNTEITLAYKRQTLEGPIIARQEVISVNIK